MVFAAALILALLPPLPEEGRVIHAETIELNWVFRDFDSEGEPIWFKQWIVWDVYDNKEHVRDWIVAGRWADKTYKAKLRHTKQGSTLTYIDDRGRRWVVIAKQYRFVTSMKDREVEDRKNIPANHRARIWSR